MKTFLCTLLFTLMILLNYVESRDAFTEEIRNNRKYGVRFNGKVYPEGTYVLRLEPGRRFIMPVFIEKAVAPLAADRLSRGRRKPFALPVGKQWFQMDQNGQIAEPAVRLNKVPDNGDELVRHGVIIAIYEGGAFHKYKLDYQHVLRLVD